MNFSCSDLNKEQRGNVGRRKLPGLGFLNVLRMFGWWLRRLRLRRRWPESVVRGRRKGCRGERRAGRRRERVATWWLCLLSKVELVVEKLVVAPVGG